MPILKGTRNTLLCSRFGYGKRICSTRAKSVNSENRHRHGNNVESLIGPGDSGGPLLLFDGSGYSIAGVNTFVEGYGGRFGDIGGGIVLAPYLDWIGDTTGLAIPEPSVCWLLSLGLAVLVSRRRDTAE